MPVRTCVGRTTRTDEAEDLRSHATILAMIQTITIVFLLTLIAYHAALKVFPKIGLLDFPERYGLSRPRLPYPTGMVPVVVFLVVFLAIQPIGMKEIGVVVGVIILACSSFIDDRRPLPSWIRLMVQIVVAGVIFAAGSRIYTVTNPLGGFLKLDTLLVSLPLFGSLPILSGIVTIGWLLLTINALNWFDGIPGQVSAIACIGFAMLGCLALFRTGEHDIALLAFSLSAIAAAGLVFDFPPAKMLLGDTGAMFFGLILGLLGVYQGGKIATTFLALGIPLTDALFVIMSRILQGSSPLQGGRDHLHHLLIDRGWTPRQVVILTTAIGTIFGASALFMDTAEKGLSAMILFLCIGSAHIVLRRKKNGCSSNQKVSH